MWEPLLLEHLQKQKPDQDWKALHGPTPELMVPLASQPGEIGFCDFTKVKRVEFTLRGEPFPHLLAACGGVPTRANGNGGHGRDQRNLVPAQRWWDYTARRRCGRRRTSREVEAWAVRMISGVEFMC